MQRVIYAFLFFLVFGTLAFLGYFLLTADEESWRLYSRTYLGLLLLYTWYLFILVFLDDVRTKKYPAYAGEKISVIIPVYNERAELLGRAIDSVVRARGNKEIIIVDDGSTNETRAFLRKLKRDSSSYNALIRIHAFRVNKGKRHALYKAIKHLLRESTFVVTIDSDTVLHRDALVRIVEPLKLSTTAAATGDVRLLNERENWLTRMVGAYYWIGLNVYKKAQSSLGMVVCCSGCLAAYRTSVLREIIDEFVTQEFFGERCTHSEDRHLTNLILKRGYKVVYVPEAVSYTETPSTVKGFIKQQMRWKRGYVRESIYTLTYAFKTRTLLFFEILLWDLTAPFFTFGLRVLLFGVILTNPLFFVVFILPSWIAFMFIRYIFVFLYARDKIFGLFVYAFFYEAILYWMNIYALFTVKNKSWITR